MTKGQLFSVLVLAVVLGAAIMFVMAGFQIPFLTDTLIPQQLGVAAAEPVESTATAPPTAQPTATHQGASPVPTPVSASSPPSFRLSSAAPAGVDRPDVLLLSDSAARTPFDINFCKIAQYYGLLCDRFNMAAGDLTAADLQESTDGAPYQLIGISARNLDVLTGDELEILTAGVAEAGARVLVYDANDTTSAAALRELTGGAVTGVRRPSDSVRNWTVTTDAPEVTREFSGMSITLTEVMEQLDYAVELRDEQAARSLVVSEDDYSRMYPIFVKSQVGAGVVYVNAGGAGDEVVSLTDVPLRSLYYSPQNFSVILPLMFTMRYEMEDEVWHNDLNYANLTIDDPSLIPVFHNLDYAALLQEMDEHDFVTTIALIPANWDQSDPEVVRLFRQNPHRYSIVQHGNNHDGYEFYHYALPTPDPTSSPLFGDEDEDEEVYPPRPLAEQEADVVEGLQRLLRHQQETQIPFERVMVFPYGISPEDTLTALKRLNYIATVNAQSRPLGADAPPDWDSGMYQSNLDDANFPVIHRRQFVNSYDNPDWHIQNSAFELFVDKPVLFWAHATEGQLFSKGIGQFNLMADRINALPGELEWRGLGDLVKRLYVEKQNDDGSIDVRMCCHAMILSNRTAAEHVYHVHKQEALNVPIRSVTVDGVEVPYTVKAGVLTLDISVPAHAEVEILITYGSEVSVP